MFYVGMAQQIVYSGVAGLLALRSVRNQGKEAIGGKPESSILL